MTDDTSRWLSRPAALLLVLLILCLRYSSAFVAERPAFKDGDRRQRPNTIRFQQPPEKTSNYKDSGTVSKGLVSGLTNLVNSVFPKEDSVINFPKTKGPTSRQELLDRIRDDYVVKNYLWTGDIYLGAFDKECRFTDPTLSFTGTDTFVKNIQNLKPIVDALTLSKPGENNETITSCRSDLLEIGLYEGYVQTRWRMVGELRALPWKPRIDVIGRTKFWFNEDNGNYRVYFYDEEWEIPAGKALLQILTPAGTIPNSTFEKNSPDSKPL